MSGVRFTANDIFRDPAWRKQDTDGRLRVSAEDAARIGLTDGAARTSARRGERSALVEVSPAMQPGHASLPNGFGLSHDARGRDRCDRRGPELAHLDGLAGRLRGHALA